MNQIKLDFRKTADGLAMVATSPQFPTLYAMGADEIDALKEAIAQIRRECAMKGITLPVVGAVEIQFETPERTVRYKI